MDDHIWSVRELNTTVKALLESAPQFRRIRVCGEVSNCHEQKFSGHWYFTLKEGVTKQDEYAVSCVMWRSDALRARFKPVNGEKFVVTAEVTMYLTEGKYQLKVKDLVPEGMGDKQLSRERLIAELAQKGYFDAEHKKPLPAYPRRIAIITSDGGDAVRDVLFKLKGRWPVAKVLVMPVYVQGAKAALSIAGAIDYANRYRVADVLIVGRGGGSGEDLDVFDDERVARAIFESAIPVVTAVGHTKNETISDLVADRSTITPTDAGVAVTPDILQVKEDIAAMAARLDRAMDQALERLSQLLDNVAGRPALTDPEVYLNAKRTALELALSKLEGAGQRITPERRRRLERAAERLNAAGQRSVDRQQRRLEAMAAKLDALSPLKVLGRGYSIVEKNGAAVRTAADVAKGDQVNVKLSGGSLDCRVEEVHHG